MTDPQLDRGLKPGPFGSIDLTFVLSREDLPGTAESLNPQTAALVIGVTAFVPRLASVAGRRSTALSRRPGGPFGQPSECSCC
jgi:hypothetical protein